MALFGAYSINFKSSARLFFFYWSVFFVMLISAVTCAVLDAFTTMIRFRKEHRKLHRAFRRTAYDEDGSEA
jgi:protein-S-isoprenylcysteine O-methyltransferase Ste14